MKNRLTNILENKWTLGLAASVILLGGTCFAQQVNSADTTLNFTPSGSFSAKCKLETRTNRECTCVARAVVSYGGNEAASKTIATATVRKGKKICGPFSANKITGIKKEDGTEATPGLTVQCRFPKRCFKNATEGVDSAAEIVPAVCGKGQKEVAPTKFLNNLAAALEE